MPLLLNRIGRRGGGARGKEMGWQAGPTRCVSQSRRSEKTRRAASSPAEAASRRRFASAVDGSRSSQSTARGAEASTCSHTRNVSGSTYPVGPPRLIHPPHPAARRAARRGFLRAHLEELVEVAEHDRVARKPHRRARRRPRRAAPRRAPAPRRARGVGRGERCAVARMQRVGQRRHLRPKIAPGIRLCTRGARARGGAGRGRGQGRGRAGRAGDWRGTR
jgi:hypothetical protein